MRWAFRRKPALPLGAALFGKLPCERDFVREGEVGALADKLDTWLVRGVPLLGSGGVERLPRFRFCVGDAERRQALLGVCAPSRDAAGREFPVAVFRAVDLGSLSPLSAALWQQSDFLAAADALIDTLPDLSLPALRDALADLPELSTRAAPAIDELMTGTLMAELAQLDPSFDLFYALYAFASGFAPGVPEGLSLSCVIGDDLHARAWLELAVRLAARSGQAPSYFHAPQARRLMICGSTLAPELLRGIAQDAVASERIWPLTTTSVPAREHARGELLAAVPQLAAPDGLRFVDLAERMASFCARLG